MKKKMPKKLLSLLLAVLMAFTAVPLGAAPAFAAATDDNIAALGQQITDYKAKFTGRYVYENMKSGYDAYCDAVKIYDAAYYGTNQVTDDQVTAATTALKNWNDSATVWTAPNAKSATQPTWQSDGSYGATTNGEKVYETAQYAASGVVYSSKPERVHEPAKSEGENLVQFMMPTKVVYLWDGSTTLQMPVAIAWHSDYGSNNEASIGTLYVNDSNVPSDSHTAANDNPYFQFTGASQGECTYKLDKNGPNTTDRWHFPEAVNAGSNTIPGYTKATNVESDTSYSFKQGSSNGKKWSYYGNMIRYTGYNNGAGFNNGLLTTNIGFTSRWVHWFYFVITRTQGYKDYVHYANSATYYIIDYSKVYKAIDNVLVKFRYNDNYYCDHQFDGIIEAVTELEQYNPIGGYTDSNYASRAQDVASHVQEAVEKINTAVENVDLTDNAYGYAALRKNMYATQRRYAEKGDARACYKAGNDDNKWTASTWSAFKSAYEEAMAKFDAVYSNGTTSTYKETADTLSDLATRVQETFYALVKYADFTPIDTAIKALQDAAAPNGDNYHMKSDVDAALASLKDATTYAYYNGYNTKELRETLDENSNTAISNEAKNITTLANTLSQTSTVDITALNAAVDTAKAAVDSNDPDAYGNIDDVKNNLEKCRNLTSTVSIPGTPIVPVSAPSVCVTTSSELDSNIANLVSGLNFRQYTVTLNGANDGTYTYGTTKTYNSPTGGAVDWVFTCVSHTGRKTENIIQNQKSITVTVDGDITLTTREPSSSSSDTVKITYRSKPLGKVYYIDYVAKNSTVDPTKVDHPNYAGYDFSTYSTDSFTANKDTVVYAKYTPTETETFSIGFSNSNGEGNFFAPGNASLASIPFNTRMEFSTDLLMDDSNYAYDEDSGEMKAVYYSGGEFKEDDNTVVSNNDPEITAFTDASATSAWGDPLYAVSIVEPSNYTAWRGVYRNGTGRRCVVTKDEAGFTTYNTEAAPNTERLLAVGDDLDFVWYAQENCYIVLYTKSQFEDAVKGNVFEGISPDADLNQIAATYAYSKTTTVSDPNNGENNRLDIRGSSTVIPDGATFVETGFIFSYVKDPTTAEKTQVNNKTLTLENVSNANGVYRLKMADSKLTRRDYNTGWQFTMRFMTKASKWSGHSLYIKYRTYVNYKDSNGKLHTVYSDEIKPDSNYTF